MFHDEKEMTDGHDVYDVPNIFKAVVNHFQMIDLESRHLYVWTIFYRNKNRCNIESDVITF